MYNSYTGNRGGRSQSGGRDGGNNRGYSRSSGGSQGGSSDRGGYSDGGSERSQSSYSGGRPSFRARASASRFGRPSFGGGRGGFGGGRGGFGGGRGGRFKGATISVDKLIAKAVDSQPVNIYVDDAHYSQFEITERLKQNVYDKGYSKPTQIQYKTIPEILKGNDILGLASTGSGKTAAFLIPMINKAILDKGAKCLIIVPTRELALQIEDEFVILAKNTGVRDVLIMGGNSMRTQVNILQRNPQFVIGTPGRLKDLVERGYLRLSEISNVILDEVDRMLDMGFIDDIEYLVKKLNPNRQSLFFSATMNRKAEVIANTLLHNPIKVQIEMQAPGRNVDQDVVRLEVGQNKNDVLVGLLKTEALKKTLVFTATKHQADKICNILRDEDIYAEALHGNKSQNQRTRIIDKFKAGHIDVLVATDVASRGLDVNNITHVINYDMPQSYEDYIHRIGRTGRAGKKGFALTFI